MIKPKYSWQSGYSQWRLLKFYLHIWFVTRPKNAYWKWRNRNVACIGCGVKGTPEMILLVSIFEMVWDNYVCKDCRHDPRPECGPDCPYCDYDPHEEIV